MGATLELVHVHRIPIAWTRENSQTVAAQLDSEVRAAEMEYLSRVALSISADECVKVSAVLLEGAVATVVKDYANSTTPDLIVMTTHGRGGISRAWLGSVADELVRSINIPTVLLRPQRREGNGTAVPFQLDHILIPLDGSELSEDIIERAVALGSLTGAHYTLMQVITPPLPYLFDSTFIPQVTPPEQELRTSAEAYLTGVADRMRERGLTVATSVVMQPQSASAILEQALSDDVDLIAMATHGRTGFSRVALGSVADKVLRSTFVPLLLLRPLADAGLPRAELESANSVSK
jgi:nucleotide-binding universal stress UspA family protein